MDSIQISASMTLGKTSIAVSPLGIGTWAWGDRLVWGYGQGGYSDDDLKQAFDESLAGGISFFDTAEIYGFGRSETLLGQFLRRSGRQVVVATKFMPAPWRLSRGSLLQALKDSLGRLGLPAVDLYQVHWPIPPVSIPTWMQAMAEAQQAGLTRAVGVSNYSTSQTLLAAESLAKYGLGLTSNQVEYSLLNRRIEKNGLLAACRAAGVTVIAYSPLAKGLLTGKYTPQNPPPAPRVMPFNRRILTQVQPLLHLLRQIGEAHEGKTPSQVALNWVMCKGALPIPGAKNASQARQNAGALGWRLSDEEVAQLDRASDSLRDS